MDRRLVPPVAPKWSDVLLAAALTQARSSSDVRSIQTVEVRGLLNEAKVIAKATAGGILAGLDNLYEGIMLTMPVPLTPNPC